MFAGRSIRRLILPGFAFLFLVFAVSYAIYSQRPLRIKPPPVIPATNPFGDVVAGSGFVEPSTEASTQSTITVGSNMSAVVVKVAVHIGQEVQEGDLLFHLDKRASLAERAVREAAVAAAEAQLKKLELQPRPEEVPPLEATVRANTAALATATDIRNRDRKLRNTEAITEQELFASEQTVNTLQAQLEFSQANLSLLKAGTWEPDKEIARTALQQAKSQLQQTLTSLELLEVRAPVTGTILQVNVRPGEFVSASATQSLIVMGNLKPYHVRVSIDEEDIPRLKLNAPATAKLRGDLQQREIPMAFVRIEPAVVPKTSLTGANTERVDTRVMQVIYAIDPDHPLVKEQKILVGQLLDVFINVH
jgi:multidrug resistance efflux pump